MYFTTKELLDAEEEFIKYVDRTGAIQLHNKMPTFAERDGIATMLQDEAVRISKMLGVCERLSPSISIQWGKTDIQINFAWATLDT